MDEENSNYTEMKSDRGKEDTVNTSKNDRNPDEENVKSKRSNLIEDSAEEETGDENGKPDEDNEEDDENDDEAENEYEKDGFVVSDEEEEESDKDNEFTRRKRKRLRRGRQFVADEDDIQLVEEANKEFKAAEGDEKVAISDPFEEDSDIDSDDMDDFIVDDTRRSAEERRKLRMKKKRRQQTSGISEEQNAEFAELFGYSRDDFEVENDKTSATEREYKSSIADHETIKKELKIKIGDHYEYAERAENYLLEEDDIIRKLDVPERIQLRERKLKLFRNKNMRGEWFLRLDENSETSVEEQVQRQRRAQGEWVYQNLFMLYKKRLGEAEAEASCPPMYDLIEPIMRALYMFQLELLEVPFVFFYRRKKVRPLTLDDLWDIYDLGYEYAELITQKENTLQLIKEIVPDDAEDEEEIAFVSTPSRDVDSMDVEMKDATENTSYNHHESIKEDAAAENSISVKSFWKSRLIAEVSEINRKLTVVYLRGLRDYIQFRFGAKHSYSNAALKSATTEKVMKDKEIDELFGEDEVDNDKERAKDIEEVNKPKPANSRGVLKKRKFMRNSMYELEKEFPGIRKLCKCIASIPHFAKSVKLGQRLPSVIVISQEDANDPNRVALDFLEDSKALQVFRNPSSVFFTVVHAMAKEVFIEPRIREYCRELYRCNGTISTFPTPKGRELAREPAHEYFKILELENKPFIAFVEQDKNLGTDFREQFALIAKAEKEGYIEVNVNKAYLITCMSVRFADAIFSDEGAGIFKRAVNEGKNTNMNDFNGWDQFRSAVLNLTLKKYLGNWISRSMKEELLDRAQEHIARNCATQLFNMVTVAPCQMPLRRRNDLKLPDDWFIHPSLVHVMGICLTESERDHAGFAVVINGDGAVVDFLKLFSITKRDGLEEQLRSFIEDRAPHIVVLDDTVGLRARNIYTFLELLSQEKTQQAENEASGKQLTGRVDVDEEDEKVPHNPQRLFLPMIMESYVASAFASSERGQKEFPDYVTNQRRAISMARFVQDPLLEIAGLWTDMSRGTERGLVPAEKNIILNVNLHPLQGQIKPSLLLRYIERVLINATSLVGVDINFAVKQIHARTTLQFVPGLGPRKALALVEQMERTGQTIGRRLQIKPAFENLVDPHSKEPTHIETAIPFHESNVAPQEIVFRNCIAFLRTFDRYKTIFDDEQDDIYEEDLVEYAPLDNTRIHPENSKLAALISWSAKNTTKEMPAIEEDDIIPEEINESIRKVMRSANEKIKERLTHDIYFLSKRSSAKWQIFSTSGGLLGGDDEEENWTIKDDLLSSVNLEDINRICAEQLMWEDKTEELQICVEELRFPFGERRRELRLPTTAEIFDILIGEDNIKVGSEVTAKILNFKGKFMNVRLPSGLKGSIHVSEVSNESDYFRRVRDEHDFEEAVADLLDLRIGNDILARVIDIQKDRFLVRLSARESKVEELIRNELRPHDNYWRRSETDEERALLKKSTPEPFRGRLITHPNFHNVSREQAENILKDRNPGEIIIRPSTRGFMFLSITWKISESTYENFVIEELEKKPNDPEISKKLRIKKEIYEDLDEIIGRYITPINTFLKDLFNHSKFRNVTKEEVENICKEEKRINPGRIPYFIIPYKGNSCSFVLAYQPGSSLRRSMISVTPEGFKFQDRAFIHLDKLIAYFKKHYQEIARSRGNSGRHSNAYSGRYARSGRGSGTYHRQSYDYGRKDRDRGYRSRDSGRRY